MNSDANQGYHQKNLEYEYYRHCMKQDALARIVVCLDRVYLIDIWTEWLTV